MPSEKTYGVYGYRWVVLVSFMLIGALTQLMWLAYAPILKETEVLMGASEFKVTLLMLMFPLLYIPVSVPAGIIIDRKGWRYAVMIGAVCTAAFSFLRIFAGNYPLVLLGMLGIAIGQPFVLNSITKMVTTWFPSEESATATGIAALSLFLGMILAFGLLPPLYKAFGGVTGDALQPGMSIAPLRSLAILFSFVALGGMLLFMLLGRSKPARPPKRTEAELVEDTASINWNSLKQLMGLKNFRILMLVIFIGNGSFVGILQLLEKILQPKNISTTTAGNIGTVMIVAGVAGCVVIPALSDKTGRRKPFLILAAAVTVPMLLVIAGFSSTALIFVVSGIMGFFLFSALPVLLTLAEENTGAHLTGTATAMLMLLGNFGGVVITVIMEGLKGATGGPSGSFSWAIVFVAALFVVAIAVGLQLKEKGSLPQAPKGLELAGD